MLTYCAVRHGEWVRIHPFANGNGRMARLWANGAALRHRVPPFVTVKPRQRQPYGCRCGGVDGGDDQVMVAVMEKMLRDFLAGLS